MCDCCVCNILCGCFSGGSGWGWWEGLGGCNNVHVDTCRILAFVTSKTFLLLRSELFHIASKTFLLLRLKLFHITSKTFLCKDNAVKKTCLASDGAPCYPKLPRKTKVLHYSCNHSKGIFCLKKGRRDGSTLLVHTGSIDGMRKLAKQAIHNSLNTCINGSVNPKIPKAAARSKSFPVAMAKQ